jgi:hypothetical protein
MEASEKAQKAVPQVPGWVLPALSFPAECQRTFNLATRTFNLDQLCEMAALGEGSWAASENAIAEEVANAPELEGWLRTARSGFSLTLTALDGGLLPTMRLVDEEQRAALRLADELQRTFNWAEPSRTIDRAALDARSSAMMVRIGQEYDGGMFNWGLSALNSGPFGTALCILDECKRTSDSAQRIFNSSQLEIALRAAELDEHRPVMAVIENEDDGESLLANLVEALVEAGIVSAAKQEAAASENKRPRGRPKQAAEKREGRRRLVAEWVRYRDSNTGSKKQFCQEKKLTLLKFQALLDAERAARNRDRSKHK